MSSARSCCCRPSRSKFQMPTLPKATKSGLCLALIVSQQRGIFSCHTGTPSASGFVDDPICMWLLTVSSTYMPTFIKYLFKVCQLVSFNRCLYRLLRLMTPGDCLWVYQYKQCNYILSDGSRNLWKREINPHFIFTCFTSKSCRKYGGWVGKGFSGLKDNA